MRAANKRLGVAMRAALTLGGCGLQLESDVTAFHALSPGDRGRLIAVAPMDARKQGSLEFLSYAAQVEDRLRRAGFRTAATNDRPELFALFDYQTDEEIVQTPYVEPITETRTTTTRDSYGVERRQTNEVITGYNSGVSTENRFTRRLRLDIVEFSVNRQQRKLYEGQLRNVSDCKKLTVIMDALLEGMFADFPGASGRARSIKVRRGNLKHADC
ncbi:MAG: DUF4136 domain-containing protein [Rhodospirillaceae bacterium]|nr:DUF4136 domain-containing protein [Rhodospirillaceae bacterium]